MRERRKSNNAFQEEILQASKNNFSRVILALDLDGSSSSHLLRTAKKLIEKTAPYLCGIKIGRQSVLNLGTDHSRNLVKASHDNELPCIIDDKLNDIDETNAAISRAYFNFGFDAIIVNPIAGWKGGLEPVFKLAHEEGKGIIALVYMSHPGASEAYGQLVMRERKGKAQPQYEIFAERAEKWAADGVVVGATRLDIIRHVKSHLNNGIHIYSPGIGTQGGKVSQACKAGSDFLIIGRSITQARDPEKSVINFARQSMIENS